MKTKLICRECGSENVLTDSFAIWNPDLQEYELHSTYDDTTCENCGATDCGEWVEL